MHNMFLAIVLNPECLRRAHTEIDAVIGTERLPTMADRPDLPYVNALMKEVMRWQPVNPLGTELPFSYILVLIVFLTSSPSCPDQR